MTIDEAIAHEREKEHEQIADWLEELKVYQQHEIICHKGYNSGYNKAIDDFAILIKETLNHDWATTKISEQIIYNRLFDKCNEIAEQLKGRR